MTPTSHAPVTTEDLTPQACIARLEKILTASALSIVIHGGAVEPELTLEARDTFTITGDELREIIRHLRQLRPAVTP